MHTTHGRAHRKVREWIMRYLPAELLGTVTAFVAFWVCKHLTGSLATAALVGAMGENIGYYAVSVRREVLRHWRAQHHGVHHVRRSLITAWRTTRDMLMEFGVAEIFDTFMIRPGLFYLLPYMFRDHQTWAFFAGKLLADLVFYSFAIAGYEIRKRVRPTVPVPSKEDSI